MFVLLATGLLLWRSLFGTNTFDSGSHFHSDATSKNPAKDNQGAPSVPEIESPSHLRSKTVSSAETVNDEGDDGVDSQVELSKSSIANHQTVENAGDVSISIDDEE